jgi:hypothetical protein
VKYRTMRAAAISMLLATQFCTAAPVNTDTPSARVDLRGAAASSDVRLVADWLMRNNKHQGNPFIVADKVGGMVFAFDATGKLLAKAPALFGKMRSDVLTHEQANKKWEDTLPSDMITPAGIFSAEAYRSPSYGASVRFAEFAHSNLLIHRAPVEWRRKTLQSASKVRPRVTYGCINVLPEFINQVLVPNFKGRSTVVVLPEKQSAKSFFAINDAPESDLVASSGAQ